MKKTSVLISILLGSSLCGLAHTQNIAGVATNALSIVSPGNGADFITQRGPGFFLFSGICGRQITRIDVTIGDVTYAADTSLCFNKNMWSAGYIYININGQNAIKVTGYNGLYKIAGATMEIVLDFDNCQVRFSGGIGSSKTPFLIDNAVQLDEIRNCDVFAFRQTSDIDLTHYNFEPIPNFQGTHFDGQNHKIIGWKYENENMNAVAFIRNISVKHSTNRTVALKNIQFENISVKGGRWVGGVVAYIDSVMALTLNNVHLNSGTITGAFSDGSVGGLIGFAAGSTDIYQSSAGNSKFSNLTVQHLSTEGDDYVGGLVGYLGPRGKVRYSSSLATVIAFGHGAAKKYAGGIAGRSEGLIFRSSFQKNSVQSGLDPESRAIDISLAGGLAGLNAGDILESYVHKVTVSAVNSTQGQQGRTLLCLAGGLAGINEGRIESSYAQSGGLNSCYGRDFGSYVGYAGGIAGKNSNIILYTYSAILLRGHYNGGLAGNSDGFVLHSLWDKVVTGTNVAGYSHGYPVSYPTTLSRTTDQMVSNDESYQYIGFQFPPWKFVVGDYARLAWE